MLANGILKFYKFADAVSRSLRTPELTIKLIHVNRVETEKLLSRLEMLLILIIKL